MIRNSTQLGHNRGSSQLSQREEAADSINNIDLQNPLLAVQSNGQSELSFLFLALFVVSNLVLFGGVYWSKFAHMFYKPGAAIQKNLAEADGSRDNLPPPADAPEQFGLGIKREQPKHY